MELRTKCGEMSRNATSVIFKDFHQTEPMSPSRLDSSRLLQHLNLKSNRNTSLKRNNYFFTAGRQKKSESVLALPAIMSPSHKEELLAIANEPYIDTSLERKESVQMKSKSSLEDLHKKAANLEL